MPGWLAASIADIEALRASWGSVRGGWRAARQDTKELLAHRQLQVDTVAMTESGMTVVLRTRIRLNGDTETDILRRWLEAATPAAAKDAAEAHFRAVAAAADGWAAALGMGRIATRLVILLGSVASAAATIRTLLASASGEQIHTHQTNQPLLAGLAFTLVGVLTRSILRLRLRAMFRHGLGI